MKTNISLLIFLLFYYSCGVSSRKSEISSQEYRWKGKAVSKKKYDRKLNKFIHDFVKNSSEEDLRLFSEMKVEYDTIPKKDSL